jgi:hypothetical protein
MKPVALLALLCALPACSMRTDVVTPPSADLPAIGWRSAATESDRARLRGWRNAWTQALARARAAGHAADLAREGVLLDPDAGLADATPPPGDYDCRTIKLGARSPGQLDYVAYPAFHCRIEPDGQGLRFVKLTGSQRPFGVLFPDNSRRMVFLGTLQLGDEQTALRYGRDRERDMAAYLERVGERSWRLAFPSPHFESLLDVIELTPRATP